MTNGKISNFIKEHWRGILLFISVAVFASSFLYCVQNGAHILIKKNSISVHKQK